MRVILIVGFSLSILFIIINYLYDNFYKSEINKYYSNLTPTKLWILIILIINIFIFIFIVAYSEYILEKLEESDEYQGRVGLKGQTGPKGSEGDNDICIISECKPCKQGPKNILDEIGNSNRIYTLLNKCDENN